MKKKERRKKKGPDLLGFNTLNVFLLVSLFKTSPNKKRERKRTERREVHEEDKEG